MSKHNINFHHKIRVSRKYPELDKVPSGAHIPQVSVIASTGNGYIYSIDFSYIQPIDNVK